MRKKRVMKQATAIAICSAMAATNVLPAFAADLAPKYTYNGANGTVFEKISHSGSGTETADGIVDYTGKGTIAPYVQGESEEGNGDRGQSYSYASLSYGDWVYVNTMYGGLGVNAILKIGLGDMDKDKAQALIQAMYNGNMYTGEPDGDDAGGVLLKFNTKTGETKILMSKHTNGIIPTFRSAVEMNGKLYFVGMVMDTSNKELTAKEFATASAVQNGFPCIYEVDPENNDALTCVYNCVDTEGFRKLVKDNVFTSTRAIGTYQDAMIAGCLDTDGVFLTASKDPSQGQDSFHVIADMNDLFNYPAYHRTDVNGGGGIYQVVEYNNALYVVVCTGTPETKNESGTLQTFAIVKGVCNGDVTDKNAWSWSVLAGDKEDGAKYPFGLDEERISAGACTLQVYDGYLYIGEYNDVSSALQGFALRKDFTTQATNLEQSINLYRMDTNENIEKVVGDPTEAFPTSLTGLGSGYTSSTGEKLGTHMNQYTWQTTVYNDKLYVGTMDTTTLLEPIAQFTNGDLLDMSAEEWKSQIDYLRVLIELMKEKPEEEEPAPEKPEEAPDSEEQEEIQDEKQNEDQDKEQDEMENPESAEDQNEEETSSEEGTDNQDGAEGNADPDERKPEESTPEELVDEAVKAAQETSQEEGNKEEVSLTYKQKNEMIKAVTRGMIPTDFFSFDIAEDLTKVNEAANEVKDFIDSKDRTGLEESYSELFEQYQEVKDQLPEDVSSKYDELLNDATKENIKALARSVKYLRTSESGFDLFEITSNDDGSISVEKVTTDGFGDRFNHGLRIFENTDDYWVIGTANPFYGTQLWRTENLEENGDGKDSEDSKDPEDGKAPEDGKDSEDTQNPVKEPVKEEAEPGKTPVNDGKGNENTAGTIKTGDSSMVGALGSTATISGLTAGAAAIRNSGTIQNPDPSDSTQNPDMKAWFQTVIEKMQQMKEKVLTHIKSLWNFR